MLLEIPRNHLGRIQTCALAIKIASRFQLQDNSLRQVLLNTRTSYDEHLRAQKIKNGLPWHLTAFWAQIETGAAKVGQRKSVNFGFLHLQAIPATF